MFNVTHVLPHNLLQTNPYIRQNFSTLCFCIKQYNFHLLVYSQPPVVRHFTNWWHLSHFPWTTAFTRTFGTSILWCYNLNGMIKWYDISCATLYFEIYSAYGKFFLSSFYTLLTSISFPIFYSFPSNTSSSVLSYPKSGLSVSFGAGLINLWHACSNLNAENFLGKRHSLLSQYFTSRPTSVSIL